MLCQDWVRRARENAGRPVGLLASPGEGHLGCKMTGQQREVADSRDMQLAESIGEQAELEQEVWWAAGGQGC